MKDLTELELQLLEIDERLRPIATRPITFEDLKAITLLAEARSPLDEAGVRSETEALLKVLAAEYENSDDETRKAIRRLFACYQHFAWAASFSVSPITEAGFRQDLILFSMLDQGKDSRDALLALRALCEQARSAGIDVKPILREVAKLSGDENKYGMGSTRRLLDESLARLSLRLRPKLRQPTLAAVKDVPMADVAAPDPKAPIPDPIHHRRRRM